MNYSYDPSAIGMRSAPQYQVYVPGATYAAYPSGLPQTAPGLNPVPFNVGTGLIVFPENLPATRAMARRRAMGFTGGARKRKSVRKTRKVRKSVRKSARR